MIGIYAGKKSMDQGMAVKEVGLELWLQRAQEKKSWHFTFQAV